MGAFIPNIDLTVLKKFFGGVEGPGSFIVGDTISPIIEIQDIALLARRENLSVVNFPMTAVSIPVQLIVPEGEFWLVHYIAMTTDVLDADQAVTVQLFIRQTNINGRVLVPTTTGNSEQGGIGAAFGRPLILSSLARFGIIINAITVGAAGNIRADMYANISRVRL